MMAEKPTGDDRIHGIEAETSIQNLSDLDSINVSAKSAIQYRGDNPMLNGAENYNNNNNKINNNNNYP